MFEVSTSGEPMKTAYEIAGGGDTGHHPSSRKPRSHSMSGKVKGRGIEDILKEGEEKSMKEDFIQHNTSSSPDILPPPPKRHA